MSSLQETYTTDADPWEELAANRDTLEMLVDEDTPFAPYAQRLLDELDKREVGE